jgi:hypothetical protein
MKIIVFGLWLTLGTYSFCWAQLTQTDTLLADIGVNQLPDLLPSKMLFTQRAVWGSRGLVRNWRPLTIQNRQSELKIRRNMLKIHRFVGLTTLAGMVGQGFLGAKLYRNYSPSLKNSHENMALGINITYTTAALLSLTAPPPMVRRKGFSGVRLHRGLAILHLSGMIATNVLARKISDNPSLKPYHRAAAYTTFAAMTVSVVSLKFK